MSKEETAKKASEYYSNNVEEAIQAVVKSKLKPRQIKMLLKSSRQFNEETISFVVAEVERLRSEQKK